MTPLLTATAVALVLSALPLVVHVARYGWALKSYEE